MLDVLALFLVVDPDQPVFVSVLVNHFVFWGLRILGTLKLGFACLGIISTPY